MKVVLLAAMSVIANAAIINCPKVTCSEQNKLKPVKADLCYSHDQQQPNKEIKIYDCDWY